MDGKYKEIDKPLLGSTAGMEGASILLVFKNKVFFQGYGARIGRQASPQFSAISLLVA